MSRIQLRNEKTVTTIKKNPPKIRRSISKSFEFKTNCLFCGDICDEKVSKHPERWKRVIKCTKKGFNESILKACYEIQDSQSNEIIVRIEGAVSDLSAAEAMYHQKCYLSCMFKSNKPNKNTSKGML